MSAGVGKQLIAPNRQGALFVDELEAVHAEVGGRRVADWRRIPRGQERLRGWVRLLKGLDWRRRRDTWLEMQRLAHARRLRARNELAEEDDALGVGRPLRRLLAECRVERIDERFGGHGHRGLLPCVRRRPPLERSPSYAPRVLAFRLDLDASPYLHLPQPLCRN